MQRMNGLSINISWEYFLGIIGALIAVAYYTNGRFTGLETSVQWLSETVRELLVRAENNTHRVFENGSPVSLTRAGQEILRNSGMKSYIDTHAAFWLDRAPSGDSYRLQSWAFRKLADANFDVDFNARINKSAFSKGISTELLRRIGGIYLRDLASSRQNATKIPARRISAHRSQVSRRPLNLV
jgi:hypothetical protein